MKYLSDKIMLKHIKMPSIARVFLYAQEVVLTKISNQNFLGISRR